MVSTRKGPFKYYVITLGGGGVGGPASIADTDDALRGGWGSRTKMMTQYFNSLLGNWNLVYSHRMCLPLTLKAKFSLPSSDLSIWHKIKLYNIGYKHV